MKNLVNYLNNYFDEDDVDTLEEHLSHNIKKPKRKMGLSQEESNDLQMKIDRKTSREEEIRRHGKPINWNHTFRDKTKYNRKDKHKNKY